MDGGAPRSAACDRTGREHALRAASTTLWHALDYAAASIADRIGSDYFDPGRQVIAEYLRRTGRQAEASAVTAIGCNEPAPHTGFERKNRL